MYDKRGLLVRLVYLCLALLWWLLTGFGRAYRRRAVVLCYHGVRDEQRERFARQIRQARSLLRTPGDLAAEDGSVAGPVVWLTFDDAFANLLDNALPVLQSHNAKPLVFAVTGNFDQPPRWPMPADHPERNERVMSAAEYSAAVREDLLVPGAHTVSHARLPDLDDHALHMELEECRRALEELTDRPIVDLALPYGEFDERVLQAACRAGYQRTYTLREQLVSDNQAPVIGRFGMTPDTWLIEFVLTCAGGYAWLGPYRGLLRRLRRVCAGRRPTLSAGEQA